MAAKKAIVLASDGMHEQLQSGDTLDGAGGATAAGATGEIQYKGADGGLAASTKLKFEEYTDIPFNQSGGKITLTDGAALSATIRTYSQALEFSSNNVLNFLSNSSLNFRDGNYESNWTEMFLQGTGYSSFSTSLDFTFSIGTDFAISGGTVDIYALNSPAVLRGWDSTESNTEGTGVYLKGGSGRGTKGSHIGIWTAAYGGSSGGTVRTQAENFCYHGVNFGIGILAPVAPLHIVKTTEQARIGYDVSNYWTATVASTGGMTWQGFGAGGAITISPTSGKNINLKPASTGKATFGDGGVTDYAEFDATGTLKLNGAATVWDDILPTTFLQLTGNAAPNITLVGASSHLRAQEFANSSANEEFLPVWQIPHKWKAESAIVPHLHIYVPDDGTGGDIVFGMYYTWTNIDGTSAAETGPIYATLTRAANAGINANAIISFGSIAGTGKTFSSIFRAKIYRVQAGADTFGGTCWLLSGDIHVEIDKLGTNNET